MTASTTRPGSRPQGLNSSRPSQQRDRPLLGHQTTRTPGTTASRTEHRSNRAADRYEIPLPFCTGRATLIMTVLNVKVQSMSAPVTRRRRRTAAATAPANTVVAYVRVSTDEQAASGLGLDAQRATIAKYAEHKGLTVVAEYADEGISAKNLTHRPGALAALEAVRSGKAAGLMVAKMDRLSRSVLDGAGLMEQAGREGWALHFADIDLDTSTPAGEMAANIMISSSQYERRLISQRTRDALAAKRARGERLGAAPALPVEVTRRIVAERAAGSTFQGIADALMADGIPTARGKAKWYPATIKAVVTSDNAAELAG